MIAKPLNMDKITAFGTKLLMVMLTYFTPVKGMVHAVIALFVIDWITGIWKSRILKRSITSYRLRKSVQKGSGYIIAIISAHILNESLLDGSLHLPQIVAGYIGLTELTSILENLSEITGKNLLREISIRVGDALRSKFLNK